MIKRSFLVLFYFIFINFEYRFSKSRGKLFYIGKSFQQQSLRFPARANSDSLISLRIFKRLVFSLIQSKKDLIHFDSLSAEGIYDSNNSSIDLRRNYVNHFNEVTVEWFISRESLIINLNLISKFFLLIIIVLCFLPVLLISLFSKNKLTFPLYFIECIECICLIEIVNKFKIKKIHYFNIFERDANFVSFLLAKSNVYVNKIPSEVPLVFWNSIIVSESLSFCFPYQLEEYEAYKHSMFIKKTNIWAPEQVLNAPPRFLQNGFQFKPIFDIGFFSSGNWLRAKLGDPNLGRNELGNESLLLEKLLTYTHKHQLSLRIFLHPIEKNGFLESDVQNYYLKKINAFPNSTIAPIDCQSIQGFDEINLGISLYSTLMFERIYLGFKTLLAPWGYPEFPLKDSPFNNICISGPHELEEKIDFNLKLTTNEFFTKNKISNYSKFEN